MAKASSLPRRTFRRRYFTRVPGVLVVLLGLVVAFIGSDSVTDASARQINWPIALAGFLIMLAGTRWILMRLIVNGTGIRIINLVRSKRVPWPDIEKFSVVPSAFPARVGAVELVSGSRVKMTALAGVAPWLQGRDAWIERTIHELNHLLSERRPET